MWMKKKWLLVNQIWKDLNFLLMKFFVPPKNWKNLKMEHLLNKKFSKHPCLWNILFHHSQKSTNPCIWGILWTFMENFLWTWEFSGNNAHLRLKRGCLASEIKIKINYFHQVSVYSESQTCVPDHAQIHKNDWEHS